MTNLELDGIELILTIISQVISRQMKWVIWYNKKKIYNTTTVGKGSHYFDDNEENKSCLLQIKRKDFFIQCVMDEYEESNATIRARHPKLFK